MMTHKIAEALALVLGGKVTTEDGQTYSVGLTRPDGRYVHIDHDAGAVYFDEYACRVGYKALGSDPRGCVDAEEWGQWTDNREWAIALSTVLGSHEYKQVGGGIYLVYFERADGRYALIGADSGAVFPSRASFLDDPNGETAEHFDFV